MDLRGADLPSLLNRLIHRFLWVETVRAGLTTRGVPWCEILAGWGVLRIRLTVEQVYISEPLQLAPEPARPHPDASDSEAESDSPAAEP